MTKQGYCIVVSYKSRIYYFSLLARFQGRGRPRTVFGTCEVTENCSSLQICTDYLVGGAHVNLYYYVKFKHFTCTTN